MAEFTKEAKAFEKAQEALRKAINERFPAGTMVAVRMNRGFMIGTVSAEAVTGQDVIVRSLRGHVHHKHYSIVDFA